MNRDQAYEILKKHISKPNLIKHSLAVEAVMRYFAEINSEDVEYWGNVGLLHDVDFEKYPDNHCVKVVDILSEEGFDSDFIKSIQSHGFELCVDIKPEMFMEKILITIDQLTGFIIACALVKPSKKLEEVDLQSMLKKWKKKDFASGTQRERIEFWTAELGYTLDYMLEQTLTALKVISAELGL